MQKLHTGMNISSDNSARNNFTGRCAPVRDAQWVCHVISANLPHISTTRANVPYRYIAENRLAAPPLIRRLTIWRQKIIEKLNYLREGYQNDWADSYDVIKGIITQLEQEKLGNCYENAHVAETILKMNGIKNASCAGIKAGLEDVDHLVCVFNTDNSPVTRKIKKNTIIVDPWLGISDFAENIFLKYKNMYRNYLKISGNEKLRLGDLEEFRLTGCDLEKLREEYPQFIFKSKRAFAAASENSQK